MRDTLIAVAGVSVSLWVAFLLADDAGYSKACAAGRSLKYLRLPFWKRLTLL